MAHLAEAQTPNIADKKGRSALTCELHSDAPEISPQSSNRLSFHLNNPSFDEVTLTELTVHLAEDSLKLHQPGLDSVPARPLLGIESYYAPVNLESKGPLILGKESHRYPETRMVLQRGDNEFSVEIGRLFWARAMSSFSPSAELLNVVKESDYLLSAEIKASYGIEVYCPSIALRVTRRPPRR